MKSLQITHFFDVIKKEVVDDDEQLTPVSYDHNNVKQQYHYKEELDLPWDEGENDLESKENIPQALTDSSPKLDYPIVAVERLSHDAVNNSFSALQREKIFGTLSVQADNRKNFLKYYCKICPKCNKIESSVKRTANCKYCNKQWIYECKNCKKQYSSYSSIICHLKSKCLEKGFYFECFKCDYKSVTKFRVKKHLQTVHSIFHSLNHIRKFESNNVQKDTAGKLYTCSRCGDEFKKLPPFLKHMQVCGQAESITLSNNFSEPPNAVETSSFHYCVKCNKSVKDDNAGCFSQKKCKSCDTKFSFQCKDCDKIFLSYVGIYNHLQISHPVNEDVFKCHQCDHKTSSIRQLGNHFVNTHVLKTHEYECNNCSYRSKSEDNLRHHITEVHMAGNEIECPKCNKTLRNKYNAKAHLNYCEKQARHECNQCSYTTKYKKNLTRHYKCVHSSFLTKSEECSHCFKKFKHKDSLRRHLRFSEDKANISCKYCSRLFRFKCDLKDHLLQVHSKDDDVDNTDEILYFHCDNCSYKSKFKGDLVKHVSIHLNQHRKECSKCKKYFAQGYLKKHAEYCGKDLRCNQCNHRVSNLQTLIKHMKNVHSKGTEIECPRCGKTYKTESYMKAHFRLCGVDPHLQCDFCSFKAKYKSILKKHVETKHSKSKKPRLE